MSENKKWAGRELPEYLKNQEKSEGKTEAETLRERMYERIIRDAEATQAFIGWVDTVRLDTDEAEVFRLLEESKAEALRTVSPELVEKVIAWRAVADEAHAYFLENFSEDNLGAEDAEMERLENEASSRRADIGEEEDGQFVMNVIHWTDNLRKAWNEVHALSGDPARALASFNGMLQERGERVIDAADVKQVVFEPFGVQFILHAKNFDKYAEDDFLGLHYSGTNFSIVKFLDAADARKTMRHEAGHRYIDHAPSHGGDTFADVCSRSISRINELNSTEAPEGMVEYEIGKLEKRLRHGSLDLLHNEFLAELNAARLHGSGSLRDRHWATAENEAMRFQEVLETTADELRKVSPAYAERIEAIATPVFERFMRAKMSAVHALELAKEIQDPKACDFVVATAVVLPLRSYHHLPEILRRKYSQEALQIAERLQDFHAITKVPGAPRFVELNKFMQAQSADMQTVLPIVWYDEFFDADMLVDDWKISSLGKLQDIIGVMREWPAPYIQDPENNPMKEMCRLFFDKITDQIWQSGEPEFSCSPEEIKEDPLLREGFLSSLKISFDGDFYAMDLSDFLGLEDRGPTKDEVLSSPMAVFARDAGVGAEFATLVEEYVP